jgi:long-chain acyl-CoA synthetase
MEKIWLASYPAGIPAEIPPLKYSSIADLFVSAVGRYGNSPCAINMGTTLSYEEVGNLARDMAAYFQQSLGLKKGDRIAIMMPNLLQYIVALYGAFRAGLVVVNVNPLYTARETIHQLNDAGAVAIVILANMAHTLEETLPQCPALKHVIVTRVGDLFGMAKGLMVNFVSKYIANPYPSYNLPDAISFKYALAKGKNQSLQPVDLVPEDIAFLQYTGGTTGISKGAMLTHSNMLSNVLQGEAWIGHQLEPGKECVVTALPLYHIFSLTANCLIFTEMGASNLLITNPRDMKGFVRDLSKHKFTVLTGVNTLFNGLLHTPGFDALDFSHLKIVMGGGMAVQYAVAAAWKEVTGKPILEAYGLTETSPAVTINPFNLKDYTGAIGLPLPSTDVKIIDESGKELDIADVGELCIRGPQVMKGYWKSPEETAMVLGKDGWLKTGDIAKIDAKGYVYLVDRKKDMILVSGFNVYPNEIEDVVMGHPGVLEAAAVGAPNTTSGQIVKLFIVKKDPNLTEKDVLDYCESRLTRYKMPRAVVFRDSLPKSNVGKILRRELRGA